MSSPGIEGPFAVQLTCGDVDKGMEHGRLKDNTLPLAQGPTGRTGTVALG